MGVLLKEEIKGILKVQGVKNQCGESKRAKGEVLELR